MCCIIFENRSGRYNPISPSLVNTPRANRTSQAIVLILSFRVRVRFGSGFIISRFVLIHYGRRRLIPPPLAPPFPGLRWGIAVTATITLNRVFSALAFPLQIHLHNPFIKFRPFLVCRPDLPLLSSEKSSNTHTHTRRLRKPLQSFCLRFAPRLSARPLGANH